ncbi:MAG: ArsA-related P-loop ATPase [Actinomycetes bacterium]
MSSALGALLGSREIVITCGPGGVGKTTTAAALATSVAYDLGGDVLVLTVDPARRLAQALGLEGLGNEVTEVELIQQGDTAARGRLFAAMLDMKQSWDALVVEHAPNEQTATSILANPLYDNITSRFIASHDYIAMERLYELHGEGKYDLIVVDTPPSRTALDFLDAPARMEEFFSSRLLRWIIAPYRNRLVGMASKPFSQVADRILGTQFLADIAEFFILFQSMYEGFVDRAGAVGRLLADDRCAFVVVSTGEAVPAREAGFFAKELQARGFMLGGMVVNRMMPESLTQNSVLQGARALHESSPELSATLGIDQALMEMVTSELLRSLEDFSKLALREQAERSVLADYADVLALPYLAEPITDLASLLSLGRLAIGVQ